MSFRPELLAQLDEAVQHLYHSLQTPGPFDPAPLVFVLEIIQNINKHLHDAMGVNVMTFYGQLVLIFEKIKILFHCKSTILVSAKQHLVLSKAVPKVSEFLQPVTAFDLFDPITAKHHHQHPSGHTCDYHAESLLVHLFCACIESTVYALHQNVTELKELLRIAVTALFHDISKPTCTKFMPFDGQKVIGYPFHGEMACGVLLQFFNNMEDCPFSKEEIVIMTAVIEKHMCGYHAKEFTSIENAYKVNLLRLESGPIKNGLLCMSCGDSGGAFPVFPMKDSKIAKFKSRPEFRRQLEKPFQPIGKPVIVSVMGTSASGKSSLASRLVSTFGFVWVNRDDLMIAHTMEKFPELVEHCTGRTDEEKYQLCYQKYYKNKQLLAPIVNSSMKQMIGEAIAYERGVVIDSVITLSPDFNACIPENFQDAFMINVHVIRGIPISSDTNHHGIPYEIQVQLSGTRTIHSWLWYVEKKKKKKKEPLSFLSFLSLLTAKTTALNDMFKKKKRPFSVYVVYWNEHGEYGYERVFDHIRQLLQHALPNVSLLSIGTPVSEVVSSDIQKPINGMSILELVNHLYKKDGWSGMMEFFKEKHFRVSEIDENTISIKYLEHNRLWTPWARDCRGIILMLLGDVIVPTKYSMQRGAEILTPLLKKSGITETQDVTPGAVFGVEQQQTMDQFRDGASLDYVITSKVDGMMGCFTVYTDPAMCQLIDEWRRTKNDPFANTCDELGKRFGLCLLVSTQNTFSAGPDLHDVIVTSILADCGMSDAEIRSLAVTSTPSQLLLEHGVPFFKRLADVFHGNKKSDTATMTIVFELVNANRTTGWGVLHTEFAVSYPESFMRLLSFTLMTRTTIEVVPHFAMNVCGFREPYWWRATHTQQLDDMMQDMDLVVRGRMEYSAFLEKYPVSNTSLGKMYFDAEGFVIYTGEDFQYHKAKLEAYYKTHKFKEHNVPYLIELGNTPAAELYPMASAVRQFNESLDAVTGKLQPICMDLVHSDALRDCLPEKARNSYKEKNFRIQVNMLLNGTGSDAIVIPIFETLFPQLQTSKTERHVVFGLLKRIVVSVIFNDEHNMEKVHCGELLDICFKQ
jgi:hypothetical protein